MFQGLFQHLNFSPSTLTSTFDVKAGLLLRKETMVYAVKPPVQHFNIFSFVSELKIHYFKISTMKHVPCYAIVWFLLRAWLTPRMAADLSINRY